MNYYKVRLSSEDVNIGTLILDNEWFEGAEKFELTLARNIKYGGIFPEVSAKLKFYGDGRRYIYAAYQVASIDAHVSCTLMAKCDTDEEYTVIYEGILDFRDVKFTCDYADCNMRPSGAVDLFLQRADVTLNIDDNPCFNELTMDRTHRRTRYAFAPYQVLFKEKGIVAYSEYELLPDDNVTTATVENYFKVQSFGSSFNAKVTICNGEPNGICDSDEDSCQDHLDGDITAVRTPANNISNYPDGYFYISNAVPTFKVQDDLSIYNEGYFPQHQAFQYSRNTGGVGDLWEDILPDEECWDYGRDYDEQNQFIGEATCTCCGGGCRGYDIEMSVELDVDWCAIVTQGIIDYFCVRPEFVIEWGDYQQVWTITSLQCPNNTVGDPCGTDLGIECTDCAVPNCSGNLVSNWTLNTSFNIPLCNVKNRDRLRIYQRNFFTYRGGESTAETAEHYLAFTTTYRQFRIQIQSSDCIPDAPRIGDTLVRSFAVHESLSRAVEHYTNNALRVKSCYFSRPNSMSGADDGNFQCPYVCGYNSGEVYVVDDDCCRAIYNFDPIFFSDECFMDDVFGTPPPPDCDDFHVGTWSAGSFYSNQCGVTIDGDCFEIHDPGFYNISTLISASNVPTSIDWENILDGTLASGGSYLELEIKGVPFVLNDTTVILPVPIVGCSTGSVVAPNIFTDINTTIEITAQDIIDGNNRICLNYSVVTYVRDLSVCSPAGTYGWVRAKATLDVDSLQMTIQKVRCVEGHYENTEEPIYTPFSCLPCETFDPTPFQSADDASAGCGAWTIFTSGVNLRRFGNAFFTSFNEMFNALDAIYNIGVGMKFDEPDTIRIENREFFYGDDVILTIDADERSLKMIRYPTDEVIYNRYKGGYQASKKDVLGTIDEFCTGREYALTVKNTRNVLNKTCQFIASGYSIEWQRRQQLTSNAEFDAENFIVCVGRSTDVDNEINVTYPNPFNVVTYEYHMWQVEQGIANVNGPSNWWAPLGIVSPPTVYNWRISPYYNAVRQAMNLLPSLSKSADKTIYFSKGETNYSTGGTEVDAQGDGCTVDWNYNISDETTHVESDDIDFSTITLPRAQQRFYPELVDIEYALTVQELQVIKANPYGTIIVNGESFFLFELNYKLNEESKLILLKKYDG